MPGRVTHQFTGLAATGVAATQLLNRVPASQRDAAFVAMMLGGLIGSMSPDGLEPAISPRHRAFFHSVAATAGISYLAYQLLKPAPKAIVMGATQAIVPQVAPIERDGAEGVVSAFFFGLATGYVSHVALDAQTPFGIPLI